MTSLATRVRLMPSLATHTRRSTAAFMAALAMLVALAAIALWETRSLDSPTTSRLLLAANLALIFLAAAWFFSRRALDCLDRAQATARLGEARLHATLQSCGDALIVTDEAGKVTMINPVAETLTGWTQNQAQGHPLEQVFQVVSESTRETVESAVSRVVREGKVVGLPDHMLLVARDGSERPIDDSAAPIPGPEGNTVGVIRIETRSRTNKLAGAAHRA